MVEALAHDLRVAFHTLGCKVNHHDSDIMKGLFNESGYQIVEFIDEADIYVINTCTVTHLSDKKSRQMIRRAAAQNPNAIIVVCGCYVQASPDEVKSIKEVDLILGTNERNKIVEAVETYIRDGKKISYFPTEETFSLFEPINETRVSKMTRAYLKVQEGCEQFCTYCIIPYARGPLRSRPIIDVIEAVRKLDSQGYNEVILTGIHLGAYGFGKNDEPQTLADLCRVLLNQTKIKRIRLSSIEPTEVTDELLNLMVENSRMARHLHIPLQSGSNWILEKMNRPYTSDIYYEVINRIRLKLPNIAITTDLIVGFPGENQERFEESYSFCKKINFSGMHIFKYSPRKGTPAADYGERVSPEEKDRYSKIMHTLSKECASAYQNQYLNHILEVLIEEKTNDGYTGHTTNYLRVYTKDEVRVGDFVFVKITESNEKGLFGCVVFQK